MIRYRYATQVQPPAPFVNVSVRCPHTGKHSLNVPALLDTAADRTVFTGQLIDALGLVEDGRLSFQGFAGDVVELPIFLAPLVLAEGGISFANDTESQPIDWVAMVIIFSAGP